MLRPTLALLLALTAAAPALGQARWTLVRDGAVVPGQETRGTTAHAIRAELEGGTRWLHGLGFRAPDVDAHTDGRLAATLVADREVDRRTGPNAIAVYRWSDGLLTGDPSRDLWLRASALDSIEVGPDGRVLDPDPSGDAETLASAVHEVFHGVQAAYRDPTNNGEWIWEGMAEAVMHAWMEAQGRPIELRAIDYSEPLLDSPDGGYDREHFWLSLGDLLDPTTRIGYLQHLLAHEGDWRRAPLATVDAALRATAQTMRAIGPYRGGLYALYPQVIAQHARTEDFARVTPLTMEAPDVRTARFPLRPLTAEAFEVAIDVDEARMDVRGIPVRLTLDVGGRVPTRLLGVDPRDALHLIEGATVAGRPALPETPYNRVVHIFGDTTLTVRVAHIAETPTADGDPLQVELRIETEGYTARTVDASGVGGALPPGFAVNGPGPWACRGGAHARAVFDLMTPDELGRDVDRALPEFAQDMEDMMDQMEIAMQRAERMGRSTGMTREQIDQIRAEARAAFEQAEAEHGGEIAQAADDLRAEPNTILAATFVGSEAGDECQMTLGATLLGREGGAQIIPGAVDPDRYPDGEEPGFGILVFSPAALAMIRGMGAAMEGFEPGRVPAGLARMEDPMDGWEICTMTDRERRDARRSAGDCPPVTCTAGQLVLESAEQGRIAGSFQFEVLRWPERQTGECHVPEARNTVTGHFNVASTDDGTDDNSLGGIGLGGMTSGGAPVVPGAPILELGARE